MKKFLEVLVDEDGKFHFSTEEEFVTEESFAAEDFHAQMDHAVKRPLVGDAWAGGVDMMAFPIQRPFGKTGN